MIDLFAFYSNIELSRELDNNGVDGFVIDWEHLGKEDRQYMYDTQINLHTKNDLVDLRKTTKRPIICRTNAPEFLNEIEISEAIDGGADEILIPMIRNQQEVELILEMVNGRIPVGIMVETREAIEMLDFFNQFQLSRCYVGLNDLSIARKTSNIFQPLTDGLLADIRKKINIPFGFGGLTHPKLGSPLPCEVLISQMVLYKTSFTFLRRSFYRDIQFFDIKTILKAIREAFSATNTHSQKEILDFIQKQPAFNTTDQSSISGF